MNLGVHIIGVGRSVFYPSQFSRVGFWLWSRLPSGQGGALRSWFPTRQSLFLPRPLYLHLLRYSFQFSFGGLWHVRPYLPRKSFFLGLPMAFFTYFPLPSARLGRGRGLLLGCCRLAPLGACRLSAVVLLPPQLVQSRRVNGDYSWGLYWLKINFYSTSSRKQCFRLKGTGFSFSRKPAEATELLSQYFPPPYKFVGVVAERATSREPVRNLCLYNGTTSITDLCCYRRAQYASCRNYWG